MNQNNLFDTLKKRITDSNMIKKQFSIIVFLLGWLAVSAQDVTVKAVLDSTHLLIGGHVAIAIAAALGRGEG